VKFDLGHINKLIVVSVQLDGEDRQYHFQELKLKKGEIHFGKQGRGYTAEKDLIKKAGKNVPYVLHFKGKGVLNRSVPNMENYRHSLLMNANLEQFYFTDFVSGDKVYSSVIRKAAAEEVLEAFDKNKVKVISFSSGPFIASPLFSFIDKENITIDNIVLSGGKEGLKSFERNEDARQVTFFGNDQVSHDMIGAVANGIQQFMPSESIVLPEEDKVFEINLGEAKQMNIFTRFAMGMVLFFMLILSVNYFYLGHLNSKIEMNYAQLAEFEGQLSQLSELEDEKNRKEKLLQGSGLLNKKFLSFYLMEMSISLPKDITLERIALRPVMDEIKKKHKIEFNDRLLMVHGTSRSSEILSRWIDKLKENDWLASVDILDYTYKKNVGNFELEIVLN
jgi:hypothetical protein